MGNLRNDLNSKSDSSISVTYPEVAYGAGHGVGAVPPPSISVESPGLVGLLRFLLSEYVMGFLLVVFTTLFIFAVPSSLIKPGATMAMVERVLKRLMDVVGATVGVILTLPLWLVVPILIKLDSPGPVFYLQRRVGMNRRKHQRRLYQKDGVKQRRVVDRRNEDFMGKPFTVIKFRTMVQDAERKCGPVWATKNDPRATQVGAILRKTRLDEIPQFLNVLAGDMSLVGPRPERPAFVRDLASQVVGYSDRLSVKPGLTGLAQVENGYDSSVDTVATKVRHDLEYIRRQSFWLDLTILLKTVRVVFTGKGAC